MSSGRVHKTVGVISGVGAVYLHNHSSQSQHYLTDYVGGIIGGYIGAKLADIIDPPTSPNHRSIGHGVIQNSMITKFVFENISEFRNHCFQQAQIFHEQADQCRDELLKFWFKIRAEAYKFVAGLALGLITGHVSHLALDSTTPKSLPLII